MKPSKKPSSEVQAKAKAAAPARTCSDECKDEWGNNNWGSADEMCAKDYHIDCSPCDFCTGNKEDGSVAAQLQAVAAKPMQGPQQGVDGTFVPKKECDVKQCAEWTCKDWCKCFEAEPKIVEIFEGPNPSQWDLAVRDLCPADNDECDCTPFLHGNAKEDRLNRGGPKVLTIADKRQIVTDLSGNQATRAAGCEPPKVKCHSKHGYHCVSEHMCDRMNQKELEWIMPTV